MKKIILISLGLTLNVLLAAAQQKVKDGTVTNGNLPNKDAILELESSNKGLLHTRVALKLTTDAFPLSAHVAGMMVYNTATANDVIPGIYYNDGTKWILAKGGSTASIVVENKPGTTGVPGMPGSPGGPALGTTIVTNNSGAWLYNLATTTWANISGAGAKGDPGAIGPQGPIGPIGLTGAAGTNGADGAPGKDGIQGIPGTDGKDGAPGKDGIQGPKGDAGVGGATTAGTNITITGDGSAVSPYVVNAISAATTDTLTATNGSLVLKVNGVASTPVAVLTAANNGLTATNGTVQLGGALTGATVVTASAANTLAIEGLQTSTDTTKNIVVTNANGVLKTIPASSLGNNWSLTGNAGTTLATNFLGTTDTNPLQFKVNNVYSGMLDTSSVYFGKNAGLAKGKAAGGNVGIGNLALTANTASNNTAVGDSALVTNTTGTFNTAIGLGAGSGIITGSKNTFIGVDAGLGISAFLQEFQGKGGRTNMTAIGYGARVSTSNSLVLGGMGTYAVNVGIGNQNPTNTLHVTPVTGVNPVRFEGLQASTSSKDKIVVADSTGVLRTTSITGGSGGWSLAGNAGTTATNFLGTTDNVPLQFKVNNVPAGMLGPNNTYFGVNTGLSNGGVDNVAIGNSALAANTSAFNTAVGSNALNKNTTGGTNTAVGFSALNKNTTGVSNTAVGLSALASNITGNTNTAIGNLALNANTTASNNTAVGDSALVANTAGTSNTAIGIGAGTLNTIGSNNTFIGVDADLVSINAFLATLNGGTGLTNATAIGYGAKVGASNSMVLGGTGRYVVNVGIGNAKPTNTLHVTPIAGVNPVRFEGLQPSTSSADLAVVVDATGVLKTTTTGGEAVGRLQVMPVQHWLLIF